MEFFKMKFIYLIQSLENSYYKIGVSKNPARRIKQLQTGNSSELKLCCTYKTDMANRIESVLHRRYSHLNKEGEWFDLSVLNELTFNDECRKIEETLNLIEKNIDLL